MAEAEAEVIVVRSQLYGYCRRRFIEGAWDDKRLSDCIVRNYITEEEKQLILAGRDFTNNQNGNPDMV